MASSALQVPVLVGCCNVFNNCTLLAFPLCSSVVPRRRTNPKCSILLVPRIVPSRTGKLQKLCIVRAITPKEATTSNLPLTDVQEAPQKSRKKGNAVSSSKKTSPVIKKIARRRKSEDKTASAGDSASNVPKRSRRKKTPENREGKSMELEGDSEADVLGFEYDWPPLVCCFGSAQNEFIPTVRVSERQMDEDKYSTWKGLQWSPPEFARAPGGSPSNVAIALVRLGGRAAFMGKVGDDPIGYEMVHTMNKENVQTRGVKFDPYVSTAVSYMKVTRLEGKLGMECVKPCAEDCFLVSEINIDILKEARMFHFNSMVLLEQSMHTALLAAIKLSKGFGGVIFFDVNLPLPLWRSRDETRRLIQNAWNAANAIEVTMQELEFLIDEDYFEKRRNYRPQYYAQSYEQSVGERKRQHRRRCHHYTREEISPLWHDNIKILFVTDGTFRIHYYTPTFEGAVIGTEDVLVTPFTCDRTGSGDAIVAGIIRKLTAQPELYDDQALLEKQLRFAICAGIIAQWTIGAVRGFPTESAAQNLKEQVYVPALW